jgi:eukaryotic-like serine/threonine-protein kinase
VKKFGSFEIHEQLGEGGMATVHRAIGIAKDGSRTPVALKRLIPRVAMNKELLTSFLDEGRLLRYLDHPHIAITYDAGKVAGYHYIAMEYIPGPTLKELVNQCAATANKMPTQMALSIAFQLADALDHAHRRCDEFGRPLGIIHRDVSLANVILSKGGVVKLIDFGLAKTKVSSTETDKKMIKGKFNYLAPEYLRGNLDARADLWALGVVMYELLTSRRLFDAPDAFETVTRIKKLPIPKPSRANPRVSAKLDEIVMKALEREPSRRWQSAASLRDALGEVMAQPGNAFEDRQIMNWVEWVFAQVPGGKEASVLPNLFAFDHPDPLALPGTSAALTPPTIPQIAQAQPQRTYPTLWQVFALVASILIVLILMIAW